MYDRQAMLDAMYAQNLTVPELAKRMGYGPDHAYKVLKGKANVTRRFAVRMATVLDVPVQQFERPAEAAAVELEAVS